MLKTDIFNTLWVEPKDPESSVLYLNLDEIRRDGGTQPRAAIDLKHVKLLESQLEDGQELEPVIVFYDGESYWLADGFHRWHAHRNQSHDAIACVIHQGSRRDAVLYSVGANADHKPALPRSREDKRRAIMTLLQDPEWGKWSDCQIARRCRVSDKTVGSLRKAIFGNSDDTKLNKERKVQRGGKTYTVNTTNIGKAARSPKKLLRGDYVTISADHPLFPNYSGTIWDLPNPDAAIVELDTGKLEPISLRHLKPVIAQHLKFERGSLVEVDVPGDNKINGRYGCIACVGEQTANVWLRDIDSMTMYNRTFKHQQLTPLPLYAEPGLKKVRDRLNKLHEFDLDPFELEILNLLERPVAFTPTELEYLAMIEQRYENRNC